MTKAVAKAEVFQYLDKVRETGYINMFGARPLIMETFNLDLEEATALLRAWMETYDERHKFLRFSLRVATVVWLAVLVTAVWAMLGGVSW